MTAFEAVQNALSFLEIPCLPYTYEGSAPKYITYNYAADRGADFGDDAPSCDLTDMQIHFFMPIVNQQKKHEPFIHYKQQIRRHLFESGFTYPHITVLEEKETNTWHLIFECEYVEE